MTDPEVPYDKESHEPVDGIGAPPPYPPEPLPGPAASPPLPLSNPFPNRFTCPACGKVFNTREELTLHVETVHQSAKKKI